MKLARLTLATAGPPVVAMGAVLWLRLAWQDRLPAEIAAHWGDGGADRASSLSTYTAWAFGLGVALTVVAAVAAVVASRRGLPVPRLAAGFGAWAATMPAGCLAGSLWATLDVDTWRQAAGPTGAIGWALGLSVAAGVVAALVAPTVTPPARERGGSDEDLPTTGLTSGERAVWLGGSTNLVLAFGVAVAVPAVLLLVALTLSESPTGVLVTVAAVTSLASLAMCRVRVRVDAAGVTIRMGLFNFPQRHLPLDAIDHADTERLSFFGGGGFGLRRGPGYTAYKIRTGEALAVRLTSGHRVLATVDGPEDAAGLVNDLVAQRRPTA